MIELTFLIELMLIVQSNQKNVIFVTIWYFLNKEFTFQPYVCNRYHDSLMMSMNLSDIYILKTKNAGYFVLLVKLTKVKL